MAALVSSVSLMSPGLHGCSWPYSTYYCHNKLKSTYSRKNYDLSPSSPPFQSIILLSWKPALGNKIWRIKKWKQFFFFWDISSPSLIRQKMMAVLLPGSCLWWALKGIKAKGGRRPKTSIHPPQFPNHSLCDFSPVTHLLRLSEIMLIFSLVVRGI